jgi:hypothetical protein
MQPRYSCMQYIVLLMQHLVNEMLTMLFHILNGVSNILDWVFHIQD